MALRRSFGIATQIVMLATACTHRASSDDAGPRLLARTAVTDHGDGCDGKATLLYVGIDGDGDGQLAQAERHGPPMVFCTSTPLTTTIVDTPANAYCPRPNHTVEIRRGSTLSELVVCTAPDNRTIAATYAVYGPRG